MLQAVNVYYVYLYIYRLITQNSSVKKVFSKLIQTNSKVIRLIDKNDLIAGSAYVSLQSHDSDQQKPDSQPEEGAWSALSNRLLVPLIDQLLTHVARYSFCVHFFVALV